MRLGLPLIIARLLADCPSVQAAAKAGVRTTISARVIRADGTVVDYGTVSRTITTWERLMRGILPGAVIIRYVDRNGREIERATY